MKRKIYSQLLDWKNSRQGEVALLIEGARRIGKSYIVEEFAKNEYESYILIDFNKVEPRVKRWFVDYMEDLDTFLFQCGQRGCGKPYGDRFPDTQGQGNFAT